MNETVLLVDDEPMVLMTLRDQLRSEGYDILTAGSAEEALVMMASYQVDVLISDEVMPGMQGTELLAIISEQYPKTARMLLTGYLTTDLVINAINHGQISYFLQKPVVGGEIDEAIRKVLGRGQETKSSE